MNPTLLLIKLDAMNLFARIKDRRKESLQEFSFKRDRTVFKELFFTRYSSVSIPDLSQFDADIIMAINQFYTSIEQLDWYLKHTQDMMNKIEDNYIHHLKGIEQHYEALMLYLSAYLDGNQSSEF